jgi:nucleotide-binding universal stress UspA family protein
MIPQTENTQQASVSNFPRALRGFQRILVATDFSEASERAVDYALSLARTYQSRVYVAHVLPLDIMMSPELMEASRQKLWEAAKEGMKKTLWSGRFFGVPYKTVLREGQFWPTLRAAIEEHEIDLVVIGTHGGNALQKMLIGSSAEELFRQARVPVLTVGPAAHESLYGVEFRNILFATELGPRAAEQAELAVSLAEQHRSRLTLMHVLPAGSWEEAETEPSTVVQKLRDVLPNWELHCLPLFRVPVGKPVAEILRAAKEIPADLIVLGAKSRQGLAGHVPHTKVYEVACRAQCPVLTLKS